MTDIPRAVLNREREHRQAIEARLHESQAKLRAATERITRLEMERDLFEGIARSIERRVSDVLKMNLPMHVSHKAQLELMLEEFELINAVDNNRKEDHRGARR